MVNFAACARMEINFFTSVMGRMKRIYIEKCVGGFWNVEVLSL